jgi:hypothetical protein
MSLSYNLFQLISTLNTDVEIQLIIESLSNQDISIPNFNIESFTIYGRSGFKNKLVYDKDSFQLNDVGSLHIKFINSNNKNKISVLLFKSGKLKISGGLSNVHKNHDEYIDDIVQEVCFFLTGKLMNLLIIPSYTITMLNAQTRIHMTPRLLNRFLYTLQESKNFHMIQKPTLTGRGRISASKVYPFKERKSHFSIDPNGSVQMFAFKSFIELKNSMFIFLNSHKELMEHS